VTFVIQEKIRLVVELAHQAKIHINCGHHQQETIAMKVFLSSTYNDLAEHCNATRRTMPARR
jgi:hypothetical protein